MLKAELVGNLGADCEVKSVNGSSFVAMRIAHTSKYTTEGGEEKETTIWVDVTYNNTESKLLTYLKSGVKVFVRGNLSLRVYSSPKDRCMKAGLTIHASEIELCGGSSDDVPRRLIVPETGALLDVTKHYWVDYKPQGMKEDDTCCLYDEKGRSYVMNSVGFVVQGEFSDNSDVKNDSVES